MNQQLCPIEMVKIEERLRNIRERVAESASKSGRQLEDIQVMAVTKTVRPELVNFAFTQSKGMLRLLGENRVQEYLEKRDAYCVREDRIHMIGHLQSNKVKYIIDKVCMIESVSSVGLAQEISRRASLRQLTMEILLQVNIASEETKSGFSTEELLAAADTVAGLPDLRLRGLMCIPQRERSVYYFAQMESLLQDLRSRGHADACLLSMGMSGDYEQAICCGATIIRLGSAIFGTRKK